MKKFSTVDRFTAQARENHAARDQCPQHKFNPAEYKPGKNPICLNCGAWISAQHVIGYVNGWQAHGGDANAIWPGWSGTLACTGA
jgi:hypothetical protein